MAVEFPVRAVLDDKGIETLIVQLTKAARQAGLSEKQIKEMNDELRRTGREGVREVNNLNNKFNNLLNDGIKKAGTALAAYFAVDRIFAFGRAVLDVTSEFQKFAAVLTNTLGSRSQAQIALNQIAKFAAATPFSVQELTNSFVKLANQGFIPTGNEMRKLGDLAASTGKEFIMLTEAIIDAQTGEFERLKEFGIRASKQGDQVTFTFKGVKTQVDFTADAIRDYITSLGDAKGVSGAMAAISETLGGQISNLEDNWDAFLNTLGQGNSGVLKETISLLSQALEIAKDLVTTDEQRFEQLISSTQAKAVETFKDYAKGYEDIALAREAFFKDNDKKIQQLQEEFNAIRDVRPHQVGLWEGIKGTAAELEKENEQREAKLRQINDEIIALGYAEEAVEDYIASLESAADAQERVPGLIEKLEEEIKLLEQAKKQATSTLEIESLNAQLERLNRELKILKNLRTEVASPLNPNLIYELGEELDKFEKDLFKKSHDNAERWMKAFTDKYAAELEKRKALAKKHEDEQQEIREGAFNAGADTLNGLFELQSAMDADRLARLQEQKAAELAAAGDNAKAKEKIERDYARKERQLKREAAQNEREHALFQIAINTAAAVVEALPNYVLAAIVGAAGVVQAALVSSRPLPRYAKGKYKIQGPGTETSDSILSLLSRNESVVDAEKSKKWGFFLEPLIAGREDEAIKNMMYHLRGDLFNPPAATDSNALGQLNRKLDNIKQLHVSIDEGGFKKWTVTSTSESQYVNKRYRFS